MRNFLPFLALLFFLAASILYGNIKKDSFLRSEVNSYIGQASGFPVARHDNRYDYPLHKNIITTVFWVGEEAGVDNGYIDNISSAWDMKWTDRFGGVDDPNERDVLLPKNFTPNENPFYFALPYNDFHDNGDLKEEIFILAKWARQMEFEKKQSFCKNQWIVISKGGRVAYAQWQDVGPFESDDSDYVFGNALPKNTIGQKAGLDVSPAVRDYLQLSDVDTTDWQFISESDVPEGPWKKIVTRSQVHWE